MTAINTAATAYIIKRRDKNGDGMVSTAKLKLPGDQWLRLDANRNGVVPADELATFLTKAEPNLLSRFERSISRRELSEAFFGVTTVASSLLGILGGAISGGLVVGGAFAYYTYKKLEG